MDAILSDAKIFMALWLGKSSGYGCTSQAELREFTLFSTLVLWRSTHTDCSVCKGSEGDLGDALGEEWGTVAIRNRGDTFLLQVQTHLEKHFSHYLEINGSGI